MVPFVEASVFTLFAVATATDLWRGKIHNTLTLPFAVAGIAAQWVLFGVSGAQTAVAGLVVAFVVFYPLWLLRVFAAGDVKLFMAAGAWLGPVANLQLAAAAIVIGAVVGLPRVIAARRGGQNAQGLPLGRTRMPFAPAILCGFFLLRIAEYHQWFGG